MSEKLMTIAEIAELLQMKKTSVYQLVYKKRIPYIKISRRCLRFEPGAIRRWISEKSRIPLSVQVFETQRANRHSTRKNDYINELIQKARQEVLS